MFQGVQAEFVASIQDGREAGFDLLPRDRREVQPHLIHPLGLHSPQQGSTHLIARSQVAQGQLLHGTASTGIHQHPSLAPHGFRDQEAGRIIQAQGRGMELNEFQVFHRGPRFPGQGDAFAAGLGGVGGVGKQMAAAAAGQHHGPGSDLL